MSCKLILCLVILGVVSCVEQFENDIPPLCIAASETAVSCAGFDPAGDGLQPHPDHCALFYYCSDTAHAPVCRQCPAGLHFNPAEHVCDVPDHAGCQAYATIQLGTVNR